MHTGEKYLSEKALSLGLILTEDDVKGLIEMALRSIKDELGEGWSNIAAKVAIQ